ncbi:peroxisomal membrane protein PEX14-like isoform X2 [Anopheles albimanus]|uniref:Peroxisomal membrane protein PEX14 n=1 Tax=Anopheles albimanus TaxID=7167 RepID=A0A182FDT2_ANOAL|nr:peroxisomal membrane protein PEX14-like isoform X2 [Anopheles albimanus]
MGENSKEAAETPPAVLSAVASLTTTAATDHLTESASTTATSTSSPPPLPPREHLIVTAIKFLNNPNVVRSAINKKQAFLRSKGLTEDEIQIACERAGVFTVDPKLPSHTVISMGVESGGAANYAKSGAYQLQQRSSNFLTRMKDMLSSVAMLSGLMYGVYWFYKRFIEPLLFRDKKKKSVTEELAELNASVTIKIDTISSELTGIREELNRVNQLNDRMKELTSFKGDLDSIKGLLLNRKQFAAPNLPIVPPSIPAWQLRSQQHQQPSSEGEHDKNDDNDTGSGSGSSENDVVLKNSDSSLEIM